MGKKSRITEYELCVICDRPAAHTHHTLSGSNRKKAEEYGLTVPLCPECHNMFSGFRPAGWSCDVHHCPKLERLMKIIGQLTREQQIMECAGVSRKAARKIFIEEFMGGYV